MENTYGIVFLTLMLSLIGWVTAHTKYLQIKRRLTSIEQMPRVSRCEYELLLGQFVASMKKGMKIATEADIVVGATVWKEYDTGMHSTQVHEVRKDGVFVNSGPGPRGPVVYSVYQGPWYIEKQDHGKEDR